MGVSLVYNLVDPRTGWRDRHHLHDGGRAGEIILFLARKFTPEEATILYWLRLRKLSLTARLAVGLICFARYCRQRGICHPAVDAFLDDLWEFPLLDQSTWDNWEDKHPPLIAAALGDEWPPGFESYLASQGIQAKEFRRLIENLVEIVFESFYAAADNALSLRCLRTVLRLTKRASIVPPPLEPFARSRFADGHGWGAKLTRVERDYWRSLAD